MIYIKKILFFISLSTCNSSIKNDNEENLIKQKENKNINMKGIFLSLRFVNIIYFLLGLGVLALYFCNAFLESIFDIPDFIMFTAALITNLLCNWLVKQKEALKCSKKRFVCLFINFISISALITGIVMGYFLDIIKDCNLFTGTENCHSQYTLWMFVISIFLFFITFIKIFL
jgi:hypothetical protein